MDPTPIIRILMVEDEAVIRALVQRMLRDTPFEIRVAATISEGMTFLEQQEFQLLLSDLRLPDGEGMTIIKKFQQKYPEGAVVLMTGSLSPEALTGPSPQLHVDACLFKPFSRHDLHDALDRALAA